MELFKQIQYNPMPVEVQVMVLWAGQNGFVDNVPVDKIKDFQAKLTDYMTSGKQICWSDRPGEGVK